MKRHTSLILTVILSISLSGCSTPQSLKQSDMEAPLKVFRESNASLRRIVLDNGMILLLKEERSAPVVSVQIWVGTGAIHEDRQRKLLTTDGVDRKEAHASLELRVVA